MNGMKAVENLVKAARGEASLHVDVVSNVMRRIASHDEAKRVYWPYVAFSMAAGVVCLLTVQCWSILYNPMIVWVYSMGAVLR